MKGEKNPIGGNIHDNPSNIRRGNAKKIAMNHMGCTRDELRDLECDFAVKNGKNVYIVEFEVDGVEYTYFIDVHSGEILHTESEAEEDDDDDDDEDDDEDDNKKPNGNEKGNGNKNR